eukprot:gnl/MRDRNA2_/MRDRNA2_112815_c0_seq1.p1 gnl/MRDRNA2_/MRDRNA2_112815_c0~~gnl/MRDRNA2_/MRDRNA2_112815_c0_seq1.p1  ORF type:complete len:628 (-),score=152.38 gnl/MRDRNA2_/MRDRNA2_112815_c0_seq1:483-2366(-)
MGNSGEMTLDLEGAKFGAINAFRTGNPVYDMLIAMIIPLIFSLAFSGFSNLKPWLENIMLYFSKPPELQYERIIEVEKVTNQYGWSFTPDEDNRNSVLLKAIFLYLNSKKIPFMQAKVNLTSMTEGYNSDSDSDDDGDSRSEVGQLKRNYRITRNAPDNQWTQIEPGLMYWKGINEDEEGGEKKSVKTKTTTVKLMAKTEERVDKFVNEAYDWYLEELKKMQDNSRYMYEMVAGASTKKEGEGDGDTAARQYRRYKLSDEKTFGSLFFPEKDLVLQLLHHFSNRTGKYAIPGYPHKLGLLLHGPPGTGKTSMIKALANHTARNIVNVPLARIATNADLMEVMFDNRYHVVGQEVPIKLKFKDVIFVMEDVDALSKIVHRREGNADGDFKAKSTTVEVQSSAGMVRVTSGQGGQGAHSAAEPEAAPAPAAESTGDGSAAAVAGVDALSNLVQAMAGPVAGPVSLKSESSSGGDKLNLSGILNALDGVVDSPNRILVMTSNHPEKLDPALIRPGRIDKKILLTYITGMQAAHMVAHYFQTELSKEEVARVSYLIEGDDAHNLPALQMTPARLEQLCAEHDELEPLFVALRDISVPPVIPLKRASSTICDAETGISKTRTAPPSVGPSRW